MENKNERKSVSGERICVLMPEYLQTSTASQIIQMMEDTSRNNATSVIMKTNMKQQINEQRREHILIC